MNGQRQEGPASAGPSFSTAALDYFAAHAIDVDIAAAMGVTENAEGIAFPCTDDVGKPTVRTRRLNGAKSKVIGARGVGLGLTVWRPPAPNGLLLACEGEGDALAACSALDDLAVASIPGVGFPAERFVTALYARGVEGVALAFDSDRHGEAFTRKVAPLLAQAGIEARRVVLADGQDLADALVALEPAKRGEWLRAAITASVPAKRPAPPTAALLARVEAFIARHVVFPSEHEIAALALFVLHTWAIEAAHVTLYVVVTSPAKRSGKTRVLEVLELLVREPLRTASVTPAALFQAVERWRPTLLVDEVDTIFTARASDRTEELRGVLNAGNARGAYVTRGSQDGTPRRFSTFCPKVLAGIDNGRLPDTIADRAAIVRIERKRREEHVERLRAADLDGELAALCADLEAWADEHRDALAAFRAEPVLALSDRLDEAWEPLFAIAARAGDPWPSRARGAALALRADVDLDVDANDHGLVLLRALRELFGDASALASKTICEKLNADDDLPFGAYRGGEGIDQRGLSKLLRPYRTADGAKIRPRTIGSGKGSAKGYRREQFEEAWRRYLDDDDKNALDDDDKNALLSVASVAPKSQSQADATDATDATDGRAKAGDREIVARGVSPDALIEARDATAIHPPEVPPRPPELDRHLPDELARRHCYERTRHAFARHPDAAIAADDLARAKGATPEVDPHLACRQPNGYLCAACAADLLGVTRQRLATMRRRGELRSIGMAPAEYRAAREAAGWTEHEQGWGPGVFYLRADLERLREAS